MVKRNGKRKGRRNGGLTLPVAVIAGFAPLAVNVINTPGGLEPKAWMLTQALTGYDTRAQRFWFPNLMKGAIPIILGIIGHKVANKLGVNSALSRAGIPFIRV